MSLQEGDSAIDCVRFCEQQMQQSNLVFGHGADNALDESIALVCHVLDVSPCDEDWSCWQPDAGQLQTMQGLLQQRIRNRTPIAYLTGHAWFAGLCFSVDPRVLIPRSPIAELIANGFELWLRQPRVRILDLCTGGGCIAIATAVHLPESRVDAVDLSATALEVAAENLRRHRLPDRIRLVQSDLFEQLDGCRYDLIVSNPPYVGAAEFSELPDEYLKEPAMALVSGEDGLDIPLKILRDAADHLEDNGVLILELGNSDETLQAALPGVPFVWLEFEYGGHGVLVLDRQQLRAARADILQLLSEREPTNTRKSCSRNSSV